MENSVVHCFQAKEPSAPSEARQYARPKAAADGKSLPVRHQADIQKVSVFCFFIPYLFFQNLSAHLFSLLPFLIGVIYGHPLQDCLSALRAL